MRFEKKCQNVNKVEMLRRKSKCSVESNSGKLVKKQSWHYFSTSFSAFCLYFQSARRKKKSLLISPLMVGPITMLECLPFLSNFCWIKKRRRILQDLESFIGVSSCFVLCISLHKIPKKPLGRISQSQPAQWSSCSLLKCNQTSF